MQPADNVFFYVIIGHTNQTTSKLSFYFTNCRCIKCRHGRIIPLYFTKISNHIIVIRHFGNDTFGKYNYICSFRISVRVIYYGNCIGYICSQQKLQNRPGIKQHWETISMATLNIVYECYEALDIGWKQKMRQQLALLNYKCSELSCDPAYQQQEHHESFLEKET